VRIRILLQPLLSRVVVAKIKEFGFLEIKTSRNHIEGKLAAWC